MRPDCDNDTMLLLWAFITRSPNFSLTFPYPQFFSNCSQNSLTFPWPWIFFPWPLATLCASLKFLDKKSSSHQSDLDKDLFNIHLGVLHSLAPGKFESNFTYVIFKQILVIDGWGISSEIDLIWMSLDFTDDQSTLVQVMVWCRQATGHYLNQCWPRSLPPYGVTWPQWVKITLQKYMQIEQIRTAIILGELY